MRALKQKTFLFIAVALLTGIISYAYSATQVRADNFYSLQNTPHACSTQAECDALNAGGPDSTGRLNSQNAPAPSSPGQSGAQSSSNSGSSGASQDCWKSVQEMVDTTANMKNFGWQMCPDASDTTSSGSNPQTHSTPNSQNQNSDQGSTLSSFDAGLNSTNDQSLSQFDQPASSPSLNVPLLNQNDPANGSLGPTACGPTALNMIAAFYGIDMPTATVIQDAGTDNTGTDFSHLESAAKQIGLTNISDNLSITSNISNFFTGSTDLSNLTDAVNSGSPALVNVDLSPYSDGHALVVTGISDGNVYVNNPAGGQAQVIGLTQFTAMWNSKGSEYIVPKP